MSHLVLDTNSLLQSLPKWSKYHDLWVSLLDGRNRLCVTNEILEEYEEILGRKISNRFASLLIDVIVQNPYTLFVTPYYHFNLIVKDPDDNKFVDCAVCGGAKFIVSEDRHFSILKTIPFPVVDVLTLDEAMNRI